MSKSSRKNYPDGIDPKAWEAGHENDVRIGALEKDGDQLIKVLEDGSHNQMRITDKYRM